GAGQQVVVDTFLCSIPPFPVPLYPNLDLEVYDPNGVQVLQEIAPVGVPTFGPATNEVHGTYNVPVNAVRGTYTVKVGVFSHDWSQLLSWDNQAATFIVP